MAVLWLIFQFPMLGMFWRPVAGLAGGLLVALIVIFCARDISRPRFVLIGIGVSGFRRRYRCIYDHCRCSRCTNCIDVVIGKPACS